MTPPLLPSSTAALVSGAERVSDVTPERIRRLRKYHELNQSLFAVRCGLAHTSASTVSSWEKGLTSPSGPQLQRILHMLKTAGL